MHRRTTIRAATNGRVGGGGGGNGIIINDNNNGGITTTTSSLSSSSSKKQRKRRSRSGGGGFLGRRGIIRSLLRRDPALSLALVSCSILVVYIFLRTRTRGNIGGRISHGGGGGGFLSDRQEVAVGDDHLRKKSVVGGPEGVGVEGEGGRRVLVEASSSDEEEEKGGDSSDEQQETEEEGGGGGSGGMMSEQDRRILHKNMKDYRKVRVQYDKVFPDTADAVDRRLRLVQTLRKRTYRPIMDFDDIEDCPLHPPEGYPKQWHLTDILTNWNPNDTQPDHTTSIYRGICIFHFPRDTQKAINYRNAEVPFVVRDDPSVLKTVERWDHPRYLSQVIGSTERDVEFSPTNHFMYYSLPDDDTVPLPEGWVEPTLDLQMTYDDWLDKANNRRLDELGPDKPHWYFRMDACGIDKECSEPRSEWLYHELEFFRPDNTFYIVEKEYSEGMHCRFGMTGVIAENHFDTGRNMIALLGGERRYILSHPNQCSNLHLYPPEHPSGRHSAVDWTDPDLNQFPHFANALGNEVVLQAGDVLYIPNLWFHFITSLDTNYQCNTRSGDSPIYDAYIDECGFGD